MTDWGNAKRSFDAAEARAHGAGFAIFLDGRIVMTPAGGEIVVGRQGLAEAMAAEWLAQGEIVDPATMPLTRLAATAIDRVGPRHADLVAVMVRFGETDLLCYRASEPADLVRRQTAAWQPHLDWAAAALGAELDIAAGVVPVDQPAEALAALKAAVELLDDFELAAASSAAAATGSLVLALALAAGEIDAEAAYAAAELDADFQTERWGEDTEAKERQGRVRKDIEAAALFISLYHAES